MRLWKKNDRDLAKSNHFRTTVLLLYVVVCTPLELFGGNRIRNSSRGGGGILRGTRHLVYGTLQLLIPVVVVLFLRSFY